MFFRIRPTVLKLTEIDVLLNVLISKNIYEVGQNVSLRSYTLRTTNLVYHKVSPDFD